MLYSMYNALLFWINYILLQTFSNSICFQAYSGNIEHNYLQYDMRKHVNTSPHLLHSFHLFDLLHAGDKVGGPDRGGARHGLLGSGLGFEGRLVGSQSGRRARRLVDQAHRGRVDCALCWKTAGRLFLVGFNIQQFGGLCLKLECSYELKMTAIVNFYKKQTTSRVVQWE